MFRTADPTDNPQSKLFCSISLLLPVGDVAPQCDSITLDFLNDTWMLILRHFCIT
jgi:hypothetical protein